jgi:antirestriction protein ArdC
MERIMSQVYEIITQRIIEKLEQGVCPRRMPWTSEQPKNLVSGKSYRGINILLLGSQGYMSPWWLTFKQAKSLGGFVKKGEKSTPVVFWKTYNSMEQNDEGKLEEKGRFVLRYYSCFNLEQVTLPPEEVPQADPTTKSFDPIPKAESVVKGMPYAPAITHNGQRACYSPLLDQVNMPRAESFDEPVNYYSTLFHELTHSTGHESRLNRDTLVDKVRFGSHSYSKEELIAEMGAAFLNGHCGLEDSTLENSAAYINGWLGRLKNDPKLVVQAAGKAQRAADFILDVTWE